MEGQGELLPALTIGGFVRWSVVQLLLCPDLEVGVLDALLRTVELRDPETPSVVWPKGLDREAVGGVDPVAGEMWGQWWGVLLEPDEDDEEADLEDLEALKRRVVELEARRGSVLIEGGVRERKRGDDGRVDAELEKLTRELEGAVGPCARCGERSWCRCGDDAKLG